MLAMVLKWITPVLSQMCLLVAGAFGVFLIYVKGRQDQKNKKNLEDLQEDLETMKRLKNVKTNTDVDAALERLHSNGDLRD